MRQLGQVNYTSQNSLRGGSGQSGGWVRVSRELRREACGVHTCDPLIRWPDAGAWGLLLVPPAPPARSGPQQRAGSRGHPHCPGQRQQRDMGSIHPLGSPTYRLLPSAPPALWTLASLERPLN